ILLSNIVTLPETSTDGVNLQIPPQMFVNTSTSTDNMSIDIVDDSSMNIVDDSNMGHSLHFAGVGLQGNIPRDETHQVQSQPGNLIQIGHSPSMQINGQGNLKLNQL